MRLAQDVSTFTTSLVAKALFAERLCTLFVPPCSPNAIEEFSAQAGSTVLNFTIRFVPGGPTTRHMRARLSSPADVALALSPDFSLVRPYGWDLTDLIVHRSAASLEFSLQALKVTSAVNIVFVLAGTWGLVLFISITTRGRACRSRAHNSLFSHFVPSAETLQVLVQSAFVQLILALSLHMVQSGSYALVVAYGLLCAAVGAAFIALLNSWVRGESVLLRDALSVDRIDKMGPEAWNDEEANDNEVGDEDGDEGGGRRREYVRLYEAGADRKHQLGALAAHDWEEHHKGLERRMGLNMFDLSEHVFDELPPERDRGLLATFLNTSLFGAIGGKRARQHAAATPSTPPEQLVMSVEVPVGLPKETLRDAMLQWKLRHTAHPMESEAVDWLLGQLSPVGFGLLRVRVPEQARLLLVEAVVQFSQQHAELHLDACHATILQQMLRQLSPRFHSMETELPEDGAGTEKIRHLVAEALRRRLEHEGQSRGITMEEGLLIQHTLHALTESFPLLPMRPPAEGTKVAPEEREEALKEEISRQADALRDSAAEYLYDDEVFCKVPLVSRTKPPDTIETVDRHYGHEQDQGDGGSGQDGRRRRRRRAHASVTLAAVAEQHVPQLETTPPPAPIKLSECRTSTTGDDVPGGGVAVSPSPAHAAAVEEEEAPPSSLGLKAAEPGAAALHNAAPEQALPVTYTGIQHPRRVKLPKVDENEEAEGVVVEEEGTSSLAPMPASPLVGEDGVQKASAHREASTEETLLTTPSPPPSPPAGHGAAGASGGSLRQLREARDRAARELAAQIDGPATATDGARGGSLLQLELAMLESREMEARQMLEQIESNRGEAAGREKEEDADLGDYFDDLEMGEGGVLADEDDDRQIPEASLKKRHARSRWWRPLRRRRRESDDHERMPCWKQYTVLFVGTLFVASCTVAVVTLFAIIPPIDQFLVVFTWSGSVPCSVVLHFAARSSVRYLRKRLALRRGRSVEGMHNQRLRMRHRPLRLPTSKATDAQDDRRPPGPLQRFASAHVLHPDLDRLQSLDDRQRDQFAASVRGKARTSDPSPEASPATAQGAGAAPAPCSSPQEGAALPAGSPPVPSKAFRPGSVAAGGPRRRGRKDRHSSENVDEGAEAIDFPRGQSLAFGEQRAQSRGAAEARGRLILATSAGAAIAEGATARGPSDAGATDPIVRI